MELNKVYINNLTTINEHEKLEELKESVKQAISKRLESPLFGFITLSWIATNWDNILILIFSKEPIEKNIYIILNQEDNYYWSRLAIPIIIGTILASLYPYLQLLIEWLHVKAKKIRNKNDTNRINEQYDNKILISNKKAKADIADEKAKADEQNSLLLSNQMSNTKIEQEKAKQKESQLNIKAMVERHTILEKENIEIIEHSYNVKEAYCNILVKTNTILEKINEINKVDNSQSINKLKQEIQSLISDDEFAKAKNFVIQNNEIQKNKPIESINISQPESKASKEVYSSQHSVKRSSFDYSTNNGIIDIISNDISFPLHFSKASDTSIYLHNGAEITKIARVKNILPHEILSFKNYDSTSNSYIINKGEVFLAEHSSGRILVGRISEIKDDSRGAEEDIVEFDYATFESGQVITAP
ncbi:TPA: hypothetical protein ACPZUF_003615 [Yersinia enterocolitica]